MSHFIFDYNVSELLKKYSSPLYVYQKEILQGQFRRLQKAFNSPHTYIYYACKANANLHLLRILREEGAYLDIVSPWEAELAFRAGFSSEQILYTGDNITDSEMHYCAQKKILVNLGSLSQIRRYGELFPGTSLCVRVNPDCGAGHHPHTITGGPQSKFGVSLSQIQDVHSLLRTYALRAAGVHAHVGSGVGDFRDLLRAVESVLQIAENFPRLDFVDVGGGIGITYGPGDMSFDMDGFATGVYERFDAFCARYGKTLKLFLEPGRFLVGHCGVLLVSVVNVKETDKYCFVGTDSGLNHLLRPALYGSYHHIVNCSRPEGPLLSYLVTGNVCETGDVFTQNVHGFQPRELPETREGDVLAICDVGAYGFSMASHYNMRPKPAEVLLSQNHEALLIRKRESFEDLCASMELE